MNDIVKPIKPIKQILRSPVAAPPPETFGQKLRRTFSFYSLIFFIIVVWAGSSLFIAPIVQWGIDRVGGYIETNMALRHEAEMLGVKLDIPCRSFETLPAGCDGLPSEGAVSYGPGTVLYFWGRVPGLEGLSPRERELNEIPGEGTDGVFYTLQKAFSRLPVDDEALALARSEMKSYGGFAERALSDDVLVVEATGGSTARAGSFYAVYTRNDGKRIAAACFGETCKVPQAPWRDGFAYGLTVNRRNVAELPAIDAEVRARLDGFVRE
jgi:hypothetical protein